MIRYWLHSIEFWLLAIEFQSVFHLPCAKQLASLEDAMHELQLEVTK